LQVVAIRHVGAGVIELPHLSQIAEGVQARDAPLYRTFLNAEPIGKVGDGHHGDGLTAAAVQQGENGLL
jgi:hypothetical protein